MFVMYVYIFAIGMTSSQHSRHSSTVKTFKPLPLSSNDVGINSSSFKLSVFAQYLVLFLVILKAIQKMRQKSESLTAWGTCEMP